MIPYDEMSIDELRAFILERMGDVRTLEWQVQEAETALANRVNAEAKALVAGLAPDQRRAIKEELEKVGGNRR